jgi:hypothetical protein
MGVNSIVEIVRKKLAEAGKNPFGHAVLVIVVLIVLVAIVENVIGEVPRDFSRPDMVLGLGNGRWEAAQIQVLVSLVFAAADG